MTNESEMNALAERMKRAYEHNDIDAVVLTRDFFDGGYVQQYVVHGTLVDGGGAFRMPDSAHLKLLQT
jgi:hypothetical protein